MRLDVLHVLASNRRRGAETFGLELHRALGGRGLQSSICCLEPGGGEPGLPVTALADRRFSPAGLRALRRQASDANVVVAHGSSTLLGCGAGLLGLGVPFVYLSIGDPRYWADSRARRVRARWLINRAAAVVAISPSARSTLISHYGLDAGRVHVIPNGRSARRFAPADGERRAAARAALNLPATVPVVATVGALSPEKRIDVAITAAANVPDAVLVVAGDGPERATLETLAARSMPERVRFLGATDGAEEVLAAADVLALTSDSEGVPGVLIEAGLAGLPVVATDVGWVSDVVRDGETGLLVPPARPDLLAVALGEALRRRDEFGSAARAHCVATFDIDDVVDAWQHLIEQIGT